MPNTKPAELTSLQVVTLILSIYVLIALFVQSVVALPAETNNLLNRIDSTVCIVFLADFFVRLYRAPSKLAFLKWGWIDLVSSIPLLGVFRVGRLVRVIRIFRILRAFRSSKNLVAYLLRNRKTTSFAAVASIAFMIVVFSSIAILQFETAPEANIKTPIDAFWWAYVTVTTVGYGDRYPLSLEGRIIGCILMTFGVGLFGTFSGFVASLFVEAEMKEEEETFSNSRGKFRRCACKFSP
jgi:voltage-gated potassium channel